MFTSAALCLATAIYFEARGEPTVGQIAVANVIVNRTHDRRYPNTICEVVQQGPTYKWSDNLPVRHRCQFSFFCDGKPEEINDDSAFEKAVEIASRIISGDIDDLTDGATHYHATRILPEWASSKTETVTINNHIFYRWEKR